MSSRALIASFAASLLLVACGGSDGAPGPSTSSPTTTPTTTTPGTDPNAPADPSADPVPASLPALSAFDPATSADVAPDLACAGKPLPVARGAATDREFHVIELGGTDADRVEGVSVDLFLGNRVATPDVTAIADKSEDKADKGLFRAKAAPGFIAYRIPKTDGYVPMVGLDLDVPESGPVLPGVPTVDRVNALSILIAGADFSATPGSGRAVIRVVDCQSRPLVGAHVVIEVDGAVVAPKEGGIRRGYFGDAEFPSPTQSFTSRSGVVAFLEIPASARSIRVVARASVDGATKVVGTRTLPLVADGLASAKLTPFVSP